MSFSRIKLRFREFAISLPNKGWIHYSFRDFNFYSLFWSDIYYEFTTMNSLNLFFEYSMNPQPISRIYHELTFFLTFFATQLWINYVFHEFTLNSSSISQIHNKFTIFSANPLWIHYLFCEFSMNPLSFSRIRYEFTIYFENILRINGLFTLSITRSIKILRVSRKY